MSGGRDVGGEGRGRYSMVIPEEKGRGEGRGGEGTAKRSFGRFESW